VSRLARVFESARTNGRAAFVAYLTAGDPSPAATVGLACALAAAGADVLELGVPFSDPVADGPTLQRAARRALAGGTGLSEVFACAAAIRRATSMALVLFSYANPLLARGLGATMRRAARAGFDGVIAADIPPEESSELVPAVRRAGLDSIFLVSPVSSAERMRRAARLSRGFLYVVSRTGPTGERRRPASDLDRTVARARSAAPGLPVAVGFGVATARDARRVARIADGVVVGSALVAASEAAGPEREPAVHALARSIARGCRR
jgi:tryptophan synthase alpha chain